ncbi:uncharacterized protein ATC70_013389 [Mucor velutinosus]|uniref:Dilute domain-containing protein n=1 Tax=Mucor velutinosus TaxID=708070 RepID=A0AAN7D712_9FUNG|nr:hypothetical protein ATC70_013389 [Mucor velutinosus]
MATLSNNTTNENQPYPTELPQIQEEYEDDHDMLKKKYENMSFDEMSQRMAESNRQISEMLSSTTSASSAHSLDEDFEVEEEEETDQDSKKWTTLFARAASNGDVTKVKEMLSDDSIRQHIDINARDNDGTPPLIYAACFGKTEIVKILIEAGAQIDVQDSFGWSALMWATNNSHEALVKILLEHGASSQTKSAKGRTVFDFINTDNQKIIEILATNPRDSVSSTSSLFYRTTSSVSSSTSSTENDFYYQSTVEGFNNFMSEEAELRQKLFESTMQLDFDDTDSIEHNPAEQDEEDDDDGQFDESQFHWDKCSPDQMFVFNSDDLDSILDTIITHLQLPLAKQQDICVPTNIIFLSARFAHYFSSFELLEQVLEGALSRIGKAIKINARNIHVLAFWITNLTQLLFYLKKDAGLVVATAEQQLRLSELISETYNLIIQDTTKRLAKVLCPAMLDHEEIPGMDQVDFTDDWHRFFRKSARRSVIIAADGGVAVSTVTPQSITSLLSSTLFVLQSYDVHPIIIIQAMAQFFHYMSCELFNRILTNKKLLCRSKAMQVRMNFSHLEDWISVNRLPNHLVSYLNPTIQLLQLLQCLTQLEDLVDFINTSKKFDALNAPQVKRCVISYRYEVNEQRIPEEIEKYAMQCAEDTVRHKQRKQSMDKARALPMSRTQSQKVSRRQSMSHYLGLSKSGPSTPLSEELPPIVDEPSVVHEHNDDDDDEQEVNVQETKDTKFMLPFSIPTTAHMTSSHWDAKSPHNQDTHTNTHSMIPIIPEEWMDKLDKPQAQQQQSVTL